MKLIGTHHLDIEGPKRLEHLLSKNKPEVITIEAPADKTIKEAKKDMSDKKQKLKDFIFKVLLESKILGKNAISKYFFETWDVYLYDTSIPISYAQKNDCKIYFVDDPGFNKLFSVVEEKLESAVIKQTISGLVSLATEDDIKDINDEGYKKFRSDILKDSDEMYDSQVIPKIFNGIVEGLSGALGMPSETTIYLLGNREQSMARKIKSIKPDIHIGGFTHVFGEYPSIPIESLYQRLDNSVSERIRLCDAFKY